MTQFTDIQWIGKAKRQGNEYSTYEKHFVLDSVPASAFLRYCSDGTALLWVNGVFVDGLAGRLPGRVGCYEVTSLLHEGDNTLTVQSGGHIYQNDAEALRTARGVYFSRFALELKVGNTRICSDESWSWASDIGCGRPDHYTNVTAAEYDRFWLHAAPWTEEVFTPDSAVLAVVGEEYASAAKEEPKEIVPKLIECEEDHTTWDFGKVCVGFFELTYEASADGEAEFIFDYAEEPADLTGTDGWWKGPIGHVVVREPLKQGKHILFLSRRRAAHLMRINFSVPVKNAGLKLYSNIKPGACKGWFRCDDALLNRIWEVGRYTVEVNRHQEYESCPRHEMKFFIGDGVPDALTDYYTYGDHSLADASLSYIDSVDAAGLIFNKLQYSVCLWDYPAWRAVMIYNHYLFTGDKAFVAHYYDDLLPAMEWMGQRCTPDGLMFQYPVQCDPFFMRDTATEYNSSTHRFGEKSYLNAIYYYALVCMGRLAHLLGREAEAQDFEKDAQAVKKAFNERLWSDEQGAYLDIFDPDYIPQDGNALAVLFGLADKEKTQRIFATMERELWSPYGSPVVSKVTNPAYTAPRCNDTVLSPMMNGYEAEARFLNGDAAGALQVIKACWGTMVNKGAETFWEFAPKDGTTRWPVSAHAWSGSCTYLLSAYVGGIRPAAPGFDKVLFAPCGLVDKFEVVVPTKHGLVAAACKTENGKQMYTLCLPSGLAYEANLPQDAVLNVTTY